MIKSAAPPESAPACRHDEVRAGML